MLKDVLTPVNIMIMQDLLVISILLDQEYLITQASRHLKVVAQRFGKPCPSILNVRLTIPLRKNGKVNFCLIKFEYFCLNSLIYS